MGDRVDVEQHRADVAELLAPLADRPAEEVPLHQDVLGRVLARDIASPIDVPPFDRSGVDGFAVRSADLAAAGEASAVALRRCS